MQNKSSEKIRISLFVLFFFCTIPVWSNPLMPLSISEIQIIDSLHWTVEINSGNKIGLQGPSSTDTFTLHCTSPIDNSLPIKMDTCVIPEVINAKNICLLTQKHFPKLKLFKGQILSLGIKGREIIYNEKLLLLDSLTPQTSMINKNGNSYFITKCPSLGSTNDLARGGFIKAQVYGSDNIGLNSIYVSDSTFDKTCTDYNGRFTFRTLCASSKHVLRFFDAYDKSISDTAVGPFSIADAETLTMVIKLKYKLPTSISDNITNGKIANALQLVGSKVTKKIIISVPELHTSRGDIKIYTIQGLFVASIPFTTKGAGTYTILWNGKNQHNENVPKGNYVCRVHIGKEASCNGIITW